MPILPIALDTPQRLAVLVTDDEPVRRAPTIYPLLSSDISHIMLFGLEYFMYS